MIRLKTAEEIQCIQAGATILSKVHGLIAKNIKEGVKTKILDKLAEEFIKDHGAQPSFKGYKGFPYTLCISTNEQVVHGSPSDDVLTKGDIVAIDCGVYYKQFHSDAAFSYPIGEVSKEKMDLLKRTKQALYLGIEAIQPGKRIGDIGYAIQSYTKQYGYSVVRELTGHGIGKKLHERPEVLNYGKQGSGMKLKDGMVLALEPMVNVGKQQIVQEKDGCLRTFDKKPSAHFEHTVAICNGKPKILTTYQ